MSRVDKGVKIEVERESWHKVDPIREDECPVLDLPTCAINEGDKTPGEGMDGEATNEKTEGDKTEDGDKIKEDSNKEKKIWVEYADFCKCFRSGNLPACTCVNTHTPHGLTLVIPGVKANVVIAFCLWMKP